MAAHRAVGRVGSRAIALLVDRAIRGYQLTVSPLLGAHCRFLPSCSEYARTAVAVHGPLRGGGLALRRIARCHPFHPGGLDPVPEAIAGDSRALWAPQPPPEMDPRDPRRRD